MEGTLSQGVRAFGMRRSRYIGLAKTALQQVCIAVGMNVSRVVHWSDGLPRARTRVTRFAALAHAVPVVCIPQGADQFANAANVSRLGAGVALDAADADRSVLAGAIEHSLQAPGPREAAASLAREIQAMPGVADVASSIEELVAGQPASWR